MGTGFANTVLPNALFGFGRRGIGEFLTAVVLTNHLVANFPRPPSRHQGMSDGLSAWFTRVFVVERTFWLQLAVYRLSCVALCINFSIPEVEKSHFYFYFFSDTSSGVSFIFIHVLSRCMCLDRGVSFIVRALLYCGKVFLFRRTEN